MNIKFNTSKPIYEQLGDQLKVRMIRQNLKAGEKLPSVRDLAVQSGVNPNTVQRTYRELEIQGAVVTKRGQGTFVTEDLAKLEAIRAEMITELVDSFVQSILELGFDLEEVLKKVTESIQRRGEEKNDHI